MPKYTRNLQKRARRLRAQMTDGERALWERLLEEIEGVMEVIAWAISGSLDRNPP